MTLDEFGSKPYTMPLWQFLRTIHAYTERVKIYVVTGSTYVKGINDFWLTKDAFSGIRENKREELKRLLEYYADAPIWNVCAEWEQEHFGIESGRKVASCVTARVNFSDIQDAYFREKADIKKQKDREYRARAKLKKFLTTAEKQEKHDE